jgi:integrase
MSTLFRPRAKPKGGATRTSPVWHIRYFCPLRRRSHVISTGCKSRKNAERVLRQFCDLLERGQVGRDNPFRREAVRRREEAAANRLGIKACLAAFAADLRAGRVRKRGVRRPVGAEHARTTMARIRRVIEGLGVKALDQVRVDRVNAFFDRCQADGTIKTSQNRKHYERSLKALTRWAAHTERLDTDPLAKLDVTFVDPERDVVHPRGEFTMGEVNRIIAAAAASSKTIAGLTGRQRALLYALAANTGYRARECAALRKQDFTDDFAFITLGGQFTKNGKRATLPVPPALRPVLAAYTAALAPDDFLWPGGWRDEGGAWVPAGWVVGRRAGDFVRADAALVGIVIGREGRAANGGRVLDFHSFRHVYISNLERADADAGAKGHLSRATPGVIERYTHRELGRLAEVVERLPTPDLSALRSA